MSPAARWGHQAVYVDSQSAMYVVGGEVASSGTQITNEVLVLPLNTSSPSFSTGPDANLPPHAFAAATLSLDSSSLVVVGGMTAACSSDATTHTLTFANSSWASSSPSDLVRRHGAAAVAVDNGSAAGEVMVVAGVADSYVCASSTAAYTAADVLSLPLGSSALVSSRALPTSLTGTDLAVSDFALAKGSDGSLYLAGGQDASGDLVDFSTVGVWTTSGGWAAQATTGDVPAGRLGASLVAHPTLDVLVLHGGATTNSTGGAVPSTLLAYLNTTSWAWSTPSTLQPPASSAVAYHTSVMTSSGVMITAFGLGASGSPTDNVYYLDMRDPTGAAWSWKSVWSSSMLGAYAASGSTSSSSASGSAVSAAAASSLAASDSEHKKVVSAVVPTVLVLVLLAALATYFVRRHVRLSRKRRLARHFSFSSQEDGGDFSTPLAQYHHADGGRRTRTQYFAGRDANEREGGMLAELTGAVGGWLARRRSGNSGAARAGEDAPPDMQQVRRTDNGSRLDEKPNWEVIDFGLGKVDEQRGDSRRSSTVEMADMAGAGADEATPLASAFPMPVASTYAYPAGASPEAPLITIDGMDAEHLAGVPQLVVLPPSAPPTPSPAAAEQPAGADGLDWSALQHELEARPAFRSISPTSTLRSHAHATSPLATAPAIVPASPVAVAAPRAPSPAPSSPASAAPHLPPLDFGRAPTITLVNPKTGRRTSEILPFSASPNLPSSLAANAGMPRSVSQPLGRPLTGSLGRRGSAPLDGPAAAAAVGRRASNPSVHTAPVSPRAKGPSSPAIGTIRRESAGGSKLRVVNVTDDDSEDATGKAL